MACIIFPDYEGRNRKTFLGEETQKWLSRPISLAFFEERLYWLDQTFNTGSVSRYLSFSRNFSFVIFLNYLFVVLIYSAKTIGDPTPEILAQKLGTEVYDIKIFSSKNQQGTNACSINNGGCQEICLFNGKYTSCACEYGELDPQDQKTCLESSAFLLFSRISRLGIRKKIIFNFMNYFYFFDVIFNFTKKNFQRAFTYPMLPT